MGAKTSRLGMVLLPMRSGRFSRALSSAIVECGPVVTAISRVGVFFLSCRFGVGLPVDFGSLKWYKPVEGGAVVFDTGCLDVRPVSPKIENLKPIPLNTQIPEYQLEGNHVHPPARQRTLPAASGGRKT